MVLLFLAVIWAMVLVPAFLRRQAEARQADSIVDFRRQLRVLQRTGPRTMSPAHRLAPERPSPAVALLTTPVQTWPGSRHSLRRQRTLSRRRDTFVFLLGGTLAFACLGAVPALRALWWLAAALGLLLAAYVTMLVRLRSLVAERETKLRFLPPRVAREPGLLLRRSAN